MDLKIIIAFVERHWAGISFAILAVVTAAVKTAPAPDEPFSWYKWFYYASHQFFNISTPTEKPPV